MGRKLLAISRRVNDGHPPKRAPKKDFAHQKFFGKRKNDGIVLGAANLPRLAYAVRFDAGAQAPNPVTPAIN